MLASFALGWLPPFRRVCACQRTDMYLIIVLLYCSRDKEAVLCLFAVLEEDLTLVSGNSDPLLLEDIVKVVWERIVLPQFQRHLQARPTKIKGYYDIIQVLKFAVLVGSSELLILYQILFTLIYKVSIYSETLSSSDDCKDLIFYLKQYFNPRPVLRKSPISLSASSPAWSEAFGTILSTENYASFCRTLQYHSRIFFSGF